MTAFLFVAVVMTALALGCLLYPLLRSSLASGPAAIDGLQVLREQARELDLALKEGSLTAAAHAEASDELRRRVGEEPAALPASHPDRQQRLLAGFLALFVPVVAAGLYYHLGNPAALAVASPERNIGGPRHEISAADVSTLVQGLSDRMRRDPANADGWYMLARSYTAIGRYQDAVLAYERLLVLVPDDSAVLADYADVLATVKGGSLEGKPEQLVLQALALNPKDVKALALAGNAAYQRGDADKARRYWEQLLPLTPGDSAIHQGTLASLASLKGRTSPAGKAETNDTPASRDAARALTGTVTLAPELASEASPGDTVFIFARAAQGPRAPLAVKRITVAQLPYAFALDDSQAMAPALKLSGASEVVVTARISRSNSATPVKGDLEGRSGVVRSDAQAVTIRIDSRI
ncbi:c-type cytochrome biogenesis protein CcmI [Massilia agri]|uniref:C-type cytochrome biogenesis protein CcmI n=1 Tax=Massilia agri TaxID=1886785 RepID=A0ABT2AM68_9BURK|nr:c-type cytochrome biogenesis protein CcmI [Massilia agri]MCS0597260.1 c-type cytochrome biogenesis protein CcmI [Massilia agri]